MIKLYADDLKAYCTDKNDKKGSNFKSAMENISNWASTWQLKISNEKSKWLLISNKKGEINSHDLVFELAGEPLTRVFDVLDIGVNFSRTLNFIDHINYNC